MLVVGRSPTGQRHAKLREIVHDNFLDYAAIESEAHRLRRLLLLSRRLLGRHDEERYRQLTYDITLAAATTLARLNPQMVFVYVTGRGTDSSEQGSLMWARVKGKTENDLLKLPFKAAYMFRPAGIQPLHGIRSKTAWVQAIYVATAPLLSLLNRVGAEIHDHDRAGRPRHDQGRAGRLSRSRCWKAKISTASDSVIPGRAPARTRNLDLPGSRRSARPGMTAGRRLNPIK